MQEMGNGKANRLYEAYLPETFRRPQIDQYLFWSTFEGWMVLLVVVVVVVVVVVSWESYRRLRTHDLTGPSFYVDELKSGFSSLPQPRHIESPRILSNVTVVVSHRGDAFRNEDCCGSL